LTDQFSETVVPAVQDHQSFKEIIVPDFTEGEGILRYCTKLYVLDYEELQFRLNQEHQNMAFAENCGQLKY